ncbi:MAG: AAA family ATPase [Flavobacteriales bacterium]|nr:AAA family ATPase [Flavobacteriales bacterium]
MLQSQALAILKSGKNVFLTGSAGTGKTYVLNQYINYLLERKVGVAITASTGIAATHMNGQTIHSWSGIGVKDHLNHNDLRKLFEKKYIQKNLESVRVLIIDEISMLHKNQLDMVNEVLQTFKTNFNEAFGGIQVVFSGDFFQLPPVTKNEELNRDKFAFMSKTWVDTNLTICYLTQQYRQTDNELNEILNEIRTGEVSQKSMSLLDDAVYNRFSQEPTKLYSHNFDVDRINHEELENLAGEEVVFSAETKGNQGLAEMLQKSVLAPDRLVLKENARVMFVRNNYEKGFMNGTLGVVVGFSGETGLPIVKTDAGREIETDREVWSINNEMGKPQASFIQIPLRLAWAITVHKSQGMTLDAAEIDLTKTFEHGQGYVALSRLKDLSGMRLLGYNEIALQVDSLALKADKRFQQLSIEAEARYPEAILEKQFNVFIRSCGGVTDLQEIERLKNKKAAKEKKISTYEQTKELFERGLTLEEMAENRGLTTGTIVSHLVTLKTKGTKLDYDRLKSDLEGFDEINTVYEKLKSEGNPENFTEDGIVRSKVLFDLLNGKFSYENLNLFKLFA